MRLLSSPHVLRAHVPPQTSAWAFDTITVRYHVLYVLSCSLVRSSATLCGLETPYLYDTYLAAAWCELFATLVAFGYRK